MGRKPSAKVCNFPSWQVETGTLSLVLWFSLPEKTHYSHKVQKAKPVQVAVVELLFLLLHSAQKGCLFPVAGINIIECIPVSLAEMYVTCTVWHASRAQILYQWWCNPQLYRNTSQIGNTKHLCLSQRLGFLVLGCTEVYPFTWKPAFWPLPCREVLLPLSKLKRQSLFIQEAWL